MVQTDKAICYSAKPGEGGRKEVKKGRATDTEFLPLGCGGSRYSGRSLPAPWIGTYAFSVFKHHWSSLEFLWGPIRRTRSGLQTEQCRGHSWGPLKLPGGDEQSWLQGFCMQWIRVLPLASAPEAEHGGIKKLAGAEAWRGLSIFYLLLRPDGDRERRCMLSVLLKTKQASKGIFL